MNYQTNDIYKNLDNELKHRITFINHPSKINKNNKIKPYDYVDVPLILKKKNQEKILIIIYWRIVKILIFQKLV